MNRICPFCGGTLAWHSGEEVSARESAGNATEKDTFACAGCPRLFRHVVRERFSGDTHWWGYKESAAEPDWRDLDEARWPTYSD